MDAMNDNDLYTLVELQDRSRRWLKKKFCLFNASDAALTEQMDTAMADIGAGHDTFVPDAWLEAMLQFETALYPLGEEALLQIQTNAFIAQGIEIEAEGLGPATDKALARFSKHERLSLAMIAEGIEPPLLAVDCGMLDSFRRAYDSDLPTVRELEKKRQEIPDPLQVGPARGTAA